MIEDLAIVFVAQNLWMQLLMAYAIGAVGILIGLVIRQRSTQTMTRMPYVLWNMAIACGTASLGFLWLLTFDAMKAETTWVLVAVYIFGVLMCGAGLGLLSHDRSVSGYGDGRRGWMAAVPILNFWLWFRQPRPESVEPPRGAVRNIVFLVAIIVLAIVSSGIRTTATKQVAALGERVAMDPEMGALSIELLVRGRGLEATLQEIAADSSRERIDETMTLAGIEAEGTTLTYIYEVSSSGTTLEDLGPVEVTRNFCTAAPLRPLFLAGATIELHYFRLSGSEIGRVVITPDKCSV